MFSSLSSAGNRDGCLTMAIFANPIVPFMPRLNVPRFLFRLWMIAFICRVPLILSSAGMEYPEHGQVM
jgi:hypothetical protein